MTWFEATICARHNTIGNWQLEQIENYNFGFKDGNVKILKKTIDIAMNSNSGEKSNKCNQCNYTSSRAGNLKTHLKTHSGENPNKCSEGNYASSQTGH